METYCPHMGIVLSLSYCLSQNDGLPCRNTVRCWEDRLDVEALLRKRFSDEQLRRVFAGLPKSRVERIVDSIGKARG